MAKRYNNIIKKRDYMTVNKVVNLVVPIRREV